MGAAQRRKQRWAAAFSSRRTALPAPPRSLNADIRKTTHAAVAITLHYLIAPPGLRVAIGKKSLRGKSTE